MQKISEVENSCAVRTNSVPNPPFKALWAEAKAASENGRWSVAESIYHQIRDKSSDSQYITSANRSLAWLYEKWNWALLAKKPTNMKIVRRNLWSWLKLDNEKNSSPFDHMLLQAKILAGQGFLKMHSFLKLWDLANLQPAHWEKTTNEQKITFDSLAEQVIRIAAKEATNTPGMCREDLSLTVNWIDMALAHNPENLWLTYYKGILLLKLEEPRDAVTCLKTVVKQKAREGWAWQRLAMAMDQSGDDLTLACACKAVIEYADAKSLKARLFLTKLLTKNKDYEKAKALIGRIYEISDASSVQLPEGIENLLRLPWYNNCNPVANIDSWIRQQGMNAIDIFTNSLIWESGCVGATFLNVKQKPRVTLVLNTCETISVSANAFGLRKMKEGDPIEIKREVAPSGKFTVLELRRRNGHSWDIAETVEAVVSNLNQKTHGAHFVALSKSNPPVPNLFYCPLKVVKDPIILGDTVCLRYIPGTKNFVFSVTKLAKSPPAELFKQVQSTVEFIAPNRSFGKLANGVFLSNSLLSAHDELTELSSVSGAAVRNFDHKKNEWSWMLLEVDEIENPN